MAAVKGFGLLLPFCLLAGCSTDGLPTEPVSGQITLDGAPLAGCVVHFVPAAGPAASSPLAQDGSFRLSTHKDGDGAVVGPHRIYLTIKATELGDFTLEDYVANKPPPENASRPTFPARYLSPSTSGLTAEVKAGKNQIQLELASP